MNDASGGTEKPQIHDSGSPRASNRTTIFKAYLARSPVVGRSEAFCEVEECSLHKVITVEQTLLALKPDAVMRRGVGAAVLGRVLDALSDAKFRGFLEIAVSHSLAEQHYAVHKGKFFYPWLLQFIEVGKVVATVLEADGVVDRLRKVLGATFVEKAEADSLRGKYGLVGGVNVAHASDEPANAKQEIALWKTRAKLNLGMDGRKPILAYIKQWQNTPVVATTKIRTLCREYAQTYANRERHVRQLRDLLVPECPGWPKQEVEKLADAILGNVDLDRKKT